MTTTMNMAHTPGPWSILETSPRGAGETCGYCIDSPGGDICDVVGLPGDGGVGGANARLISAAPELLEVARIIAGDGKYGTKDYPLSSIARLARAAIRKAEGAAR